MKQKRSMKIHARRKEPQVAVRCTVSRSPHWVLKSCLRERVNSKDIPNDAQNRRDVSPSRYNRRSSSSYPFSSPVAARTEGIQKWMEVEIKRKGTRVLLRPPSVILIPRTERKRVQHHNRNIFAPDSTNITKGRPRNTIVNSSINMTTT